MIGESVPWTASNGGKRDTVVSPMTERVALTFIGRPLALSFVEFAGNRAARLDLDLTVHSAREERCALEVSGQRDLIDAFEMACSLGPLDCLVIDCQRRQLVA